MFLNLELITNTSNLANMFFACTIFITLIFLAYELAVSFEALKEHLDMMKSWKNKIKF